MLALRALRAKPLTTTLSARTTALNAQQRRFESYFTPVAPPPTALGRYRALSPNASVHVSPLALGAQSIGDQWHKIGFGSMDKESSFKLLDAYYEAGGNFIDTANN
jgi:hypothetical protein